MAQDLNMPLALDDIEVPDGRRTVNAQTVKRLAESIEKIGLRHPVTVRRKGDLYILVAGLHRLEAYRKLGREHIPAIISSFTNADARLWEIAENLHRADLSVQERSDHVAEWVKLTEQVSREVRGKPQGGRPEGGVAAAARDLDLPETNVRQAVKIASITPDARKAADDAGLTTQRERLEIAKAPPDLQVAAVHRLHTTKMADAPLSDTESIEKQVATLMSAWNKASPEARKEFMGRIDEPVMDRRYSK